MDEEALSHQLESDNNSKKNHQKSNLFPTLLKPKTLKISTISNTFSSFSSWVSKSVKISNGFFSKRAGFNGMVVNNSLYWKSPSFLEAEMEGFAENKEETEGINGNEIEECLDVVEEEESSSSSDYLPSEVTTLNEEQHSNFSEDSSSFLSSMGGSETVQKSESPQSVCSNVSEDLEKSHLDNRKLEKQGSSMPEMEMMKERFSKLLLGEDMSGCGNGVCTALAISNAITNLCATLFGQIRRLEPLPPEKKSMWRREMEWLLCVSDYIVELIPCWQNFPDGSKLEVMSCRPRSDLYINLPALCKLDNMLLEVLDSFDDTEFWYVDQGIQAPEVNGSTSFRNPLPRQEEKWWLPAPRVPTGGLSDNSRKQLQHKRDCTNQILKAAMAINSITLADMDVPQSFLDTLPKNGKVCLGDLIHRYVTSDQFSPECLLDCLDLSSEHQALEIANRVEASIYMWRRRTSSKPVSSMNRSFSKSSWEMVKDLVMDADKRDLLAERAESLLLCLRQRFPGLTQTALDMSKIQYNKDVGKSILESYSRVLESLAFNIVARIDDLLYVDDLTKHSDNFLSISRVGLIPQNTVGNHYPVPISTTPYKTAFATPSFSPSQPISSAKGERSSFRDRKNLPLDRGFSVKKVLTDYLSIDTKGKHYASQDIRADSLSSSTTRHESPVSQTEGSHFASQGTRSDSLSTTQQVSPVSQTVGLDYASQGTRSDSLSTTQQVSPVSQTEGLDYASQGTSARSDSLSRSTIRQASPVSQTEGIASPESFSDGDSKVSK